VAYDGNIIRKIPEIAGKPFGVISSQAEHMPEGSETIMGTPQIITYVCGDGIVQSLWQQGANTNEAGEPRCNSWHRKC
jgi:hypothetical protein